MLLLLFFALFLMRGIFFNNEKHGPTRQSGDDAKCQRNEPSPQTKVAVRTVQGVTR